MHGATTKAWLNHTVINPTFYFHMMVNAMIVFALSALAWDIAGELSKANEAEIHIVYSEYLGALSAIRILPYECNSGSLQHQVYLLIHCLLSYQV